VRGDFKKGISDIDFFAVITNDDAIPPLRSILNECCRDLDIVEVDLGWEYLENISDPMNKGYPFKFLTIYQEDFIQNHIVIYGEDITDLMPRYNVRELIPWRCKVILGHLERMKDNPKMLHILAGETARFIGWLHTNSLEKNDIQRVLLEIGDEDALRIYMSYLNKREMRHPKHYLINFIKTRLSNIINEYSR
jgi:hypothetical protein